jgi:predicted RND superfamily exporter protein
VPILGGSPVERLNSQRYLSFRQLLSLLYFFPALAAILLFLHRNLRWMLICLVPTLTGVIVYLGLMGWIGVPLNIVSSIALAMVLGVSVDDVVYLTVFYRQRAREDPAGALVSTVHHAGIAIFQTTLIINLGLMVLTLSSYRSIAEIAVLGMATLSFCTAVTYLFVPRLIRFMINKEQVRGG